MELTGRTWVASDHHFDHNRLTLFEPMRQALADQLGYPSFEEMQVDKHNKKVHPEDTVLFLGDFSWKSPQPWLERLNGVKTLVLGNHDRPMTGYSKELLTVVNGVWFTDKEGRTFKYNSDDKLLSAIIKDFGERRVMFCHYALFYEDEYDTQREGRIKQRKAVLENIARHFKVTNIVHGHLHSKDTRLSTHFNASLEHLDCAPIRLEHILKRF